MKETLNEYPASEKDMPVQFLSEHQLAEFEKADANPFIKICLPDKIIPFVVLSDGGVIADITANNPKTIIENLEPIISADKLNRGAGYIDVYYGNRTLVFRHVESSIFEKKWIVDDIASALQLELNLYYPGYQVRSH